MDEELENGFGNSSQHTCYICGEENIHEIEMNAHMNAHLERPFCLFCDFVSVSAGEMTRHINLIHPSVTNDPTGKARDKIICLFCDFVSVNAGEMTRHINLIHPSDTNDTTRKARDKIICLFCDFEAVGCDEMTRHINLIHLNDTPCNANDGAVSKNGPDNRINQAKDKIPAVRYTQTVLGTKNGFVQVEMDHNGTKKEDRIPCKPNNELSSNNLALTESAETNGHYGRHAEKGECYMRNDISDTCSKSVAGDNAVASSSKCVSNPDESLNFPTCRSEGGRISTRKTRSQFGSESYLCPFCDFVTDDEQTYEGHLNEEQRLSEDSTPPGAACPAVGRVVQSAFPCPVCGMAFAECGALQAHVERHFGGGLSIKRNELSDSSRNSRSHQPDSTNQSYEPNGRTFQHPSTLPPQLNRPSEALSQNDGDVPWQQPGSRPEMTAAIQARNAGDVTRPLPSAMYRDDMSSATLGVHERLLKHYEGGNRYVSNAWLCSYVVHFASKFDRGWGCGYRNCQMLLSCLLTSPVYSAHLLEGENFVPSVLRLQQMLEAAWSKGFDEDGRMNFGGQVVHSKKWIGATDIAAMLSSLKVRCTVVDIHCPTQPNNTHPLLFQWVKRYFEKPDQFKPPLYLQYDGHSKTIVGVEEHDDSSLRLLILDPSAQPSKMGQAVRAKETMPLIRLIRSPLSYLKRKQYQILSVNGIMCNEDEIEASKIIKSIRIPAS